MLIPRQRFEQYLTSSQHEAHFLRQVKGRLLVAKVFSGMWVFLCMHVEIGAVRLLLKSSGKKTPTKRVGVFGCLTAYLVEAAGIEPASASTPPSALHAYPGLFI